MFLCEPCIKGCISRICNTSCPHGKKGYQIFPINVGLLHKNAQIISNTGIFLVSLSMSTPQTRHYGHCWKSSLVNVMSHSGGSRVVSVVSGNYLKILEEIHTRTIWTRTELFHCVSFCVSGNANAVFFGASMRRFAHNSCDRTAKMRFSSVASHRSPLGGVPR